MARTISFSNWNFRFFRVNGKYNHNAMKMFSSNWDRFISGGFTQTKVSCNVHYFSMVTKYCFPSLETCSCNHDSGMNHVQCTRLITWMLVPLGEWVIACFKKFPLVSSIDTNHSPCRNGKVIAGDNEQSSVPNIFAIGDMADGKLELTPVAIQAGKLLAQRLYGDSNELVSGTYFQDHKNKAVVCSL